MNVLILGGTQFIGRQIVETLLAAGHRVTVLTRGKSVDELPTQVERLRGDRDQGLPGLAALNNRSWDACLDVSGYTPRQVRPSAELLHASVKRYLVISSCAVYGDPTLRPIQETHPVLPPAAEDVTTIDGATYGPLKVTCENIVRQVYGERSTILRPQVVVGPRDPTVRYGYWVERARRGGEMLAPGDGNDHLQVVDVRDVARFAAMAIENNINGTFSLVGPRFTWAEFTRILGATNVVWVSVDILKAAGVTESALPLFRANNDPRSARMDISNDRAKAAGLTVTTPEATFASMKDYVLPKEATSLFSPAREAELIRLARGQSR